MTHNHDEHEATPPWDAASVNLTSKEMAPGGVTLIVVQIVTLLRRVYRIDLEGNITLLGNISCVKSRGCC